jgi:hypothetical protein
MRDSNETPTVVADTVPACRACGTKLANREYYCPECDTPHLPHLLPSLAAPGVRTFVFAAIIAGPVFLYTLYEVVIRFAATI